MNNKKNYTTEIMLGIGILFVVIAGIIFASTAWTYLNDTGKQLVIGGVAVLLYILSYTSDKKFELKKTSIALFYIADVFSGIYVYLSTRGIITANMTLALVVIAIPLLLRTVVKKTCADAALACITLNIALLASNEIFKDTRIECAIFAAVIAGYGLFRLFSNDVADRYIVTLAINIVVFVKMYFWCTIAVLLSKFKRDSYEFEGVVMLLSAAIILLITVEYIKNRKTAIRVIHSFTLLFVAFSGLWIFGISSHMSVFIVMCALTALCARKEMLIATGVYGLFVKLIEIMAGEYDPYVIVYVAFAMAVIVRWYIIGKISKKRVCEVGISLVLQIVIELVHYANMHVECNGLFNMSIIVTVELIALAILVIRRKEKTSYKLISCACISASGILMSQNIVSIPENINCEYVCVCFLVGMLCATKVLSNVVGDIKDLRFVGVAFVIISDMVYNVNYGGAVNAIIIGVAGLVMLLVAAIAERREYLVLALSTLIITLLYVTKDLWTNLAWWVYLLIAGITLITIAIVREKKGER